MNKIFLRTVSCAAAVVLAVLGFAGCGKGSPLSESVSAIKDEGPTESLTENDTDNIRRISYELGGLADDFTYAPTSAEPGSTVEIRTVVLFDADIHVYLDGNEIEKSHYDSDYWGYSFIMPDNDVTVSAKPYTKAEIWGVDDLTWVKEAYFEYLKENGLLDPAYGPRSASDLEIQTYVGTFGDGCVVAYMGGDALCFTEALRPERYGDNIIIFRDGQICHAFYNNETHTIGQAYEEGILTDADIAEINAAVGCSID